VEIFEALERDAAAVGRDITGVFRRRHTSATQDAAAVTIKATTPGGPVNVIAEGKTLLHNALEKFEAVDEDAIGVVEAIKVNPTAISITNTLAGIAHIPDPDGDLAAIDSLLKVVGTKLAQAAQATAPAPAEAQQAQDAPAGPFVAGQA
jgi:hypothetical protein